MSVVIRSTRSSRILTPTRDARPSSYAVNALFIGTSNQLGEFESGVTAALFGPIGAVVLGGCGTILVAIACFRIFPALARIDSPVEVGPDVSALASKPAPAT